MPITKDEVIYNIDPSAYGAKELTITTPEVTVTAPRKRPVQYSSAYDPYAFTDGIDWIMENTVGKPIEWLVDKTGTQGIVQPILSTLTPSNWVGVTKGYAPWSPLNPGFGADKHGLAYNTLVNTGAMFILPKIGDRIKHLTNNVQDYHNLNLFINRYGYHEYKPKIGLILDDAKLDKLTNQLVKQHNTFTRGVSIDEARKYYGLPENWTDLQIAEYTLTHPHKPNDINSGGNPKQAPVLYTSNSLDLSKIYTNGGNGYVGILQRPIVYDIDRSKMLQLNDFRFNKQLVEPGSPSFSVTTDDPYISPITSKLPKFWRVDGGFAYRRRGKIMSKYKPVQNTNLNAYANKGSEYVATKTPDDLNFRHYLWFEEPDKQIMDLKGLFRYSAPKGTPSIDFERYSVGFSKKK